MRHKAWMSTIAYWLGLVALFSLPYRNSEWINWLPAILLTYIVASITISVGYHRLFCHNSFKTNSFWHYLFAITGTLFMYSSPLQWAVTHSTHHKRSDSDLDPHPLPKYAMFFKGYRNVPLDTWQARRLIKSSGIFHAFIDKWYVGIFVSLVILIWLIYPNYVIYAFLPSLGVSHFIGGLHNVISHSAKRPRDLAFMEYILPASGEWLHGGHHDKPGRSDFRTKWYHFDLGALVIKSIKKR